MILNWRPQAGRQNTQASAVGPVGFAIVWRSVGTSATAAFPFTYHRQSDGLIFHRSWSN